MTDCFKSGLFDNVSVLEEISIFDILSTVKTIVNIANRKTRQEC